MKYNYYFPSPISVEEKPEFIIEKAVKGMLPKNRLGRQLFRNLFVYEDANHPHESQNPKLIDFGKINSKNISLIN